MNTQKRNLPSPDKGFQLAAGMGHSVHFMKCIGQERYFAISVQIGAPHPARPAAPRTQIAMLFSRRESLTIASRAEASGPWWVQYSPRWSKVSSAVQPR